MASLKIQKKTKWKSQAGVYGYGGEHSSNWWVSMAAALLGRERSEREERNLEVLNRRAANHWPHKLNHRSDTTSG